MIQQKSDTALFLKGNLFILIATIFFGVNIPVVKLLIPHWMSAMDVSAFRLFGRVRTVLAGVALCQNRTYCEERLAQPDFRRSGRLVFVYISFQSFAQICRSDRCVDHKMTLPPVFVIIIGVIFMHRRVSWLELLGVAIAFAGAIVVIVSGRAKDSDGSHLFGDLLALASALCYAIYLVITERPSKTYRPVTMLRWVFLFSAVPAVFLLPALPHAEIFHDISFQPWALIAFVVICPTFLAYFLVSPAIRLIGSELVSIYQYLVSVVATVASVAIGICGIHAAQIAAMAIVIGGMALTTIAARKRRRES